MERRDARAALVEALKNQLDRVWIKAGEITVEIASRINEATMHANTRLVHDAAWATASSIIELIRPVLRDEEVNDALHEIYQRCRAGIESKLIMATREECRRNPSRN